MAIVFRPALTLATFGIALTAGILGLLIHFIMGLDLLYSLLIGSIISSTDAAAVFMIMRQRAIKKRVSLTLEVESATNDPMAIMLTIVFIQIITGHPQNIGLFILNLIWQFGGGIVVGWLISKVGAFLFNNLKVENRGYYHVLSIAVCLLAYGSAEVVKANGIIAVFFAGYWLGNTDFAYRKGVGNFIEGISTFSNIAIFLLREFWFFPKAYCRFGKKDY